MSDEVLDRLVRFGQQAEADALRLSPAADQLGDAESRQRASDAWRLFAVRWEAVRAYSEAGAPRAAEHATSGVNPSNGADSLASSRPFPGGHAAPAPAACPPHSSAAPLRASAVGPTADSDLVLLLEHLANRTREPLESVLDGPVSRLA